jgi:putative Mn2+ efflux pump MntP
MILSIILIGAGLSMDALAVSIANGLSLKPFRFSHALWMGLYFGGFQFLMPLAGALLAGTVRDKILALGPYISFFLLAYIGGNMVYSALFSPQEETPGMTRLSHRRLLLLAVATSIDALAAGVSFAFVPGLSLLPACSLVGLTTFCISTGGALLASRISNFSSRSAELLGGITLILIGLKLLLEGI